MEEYNAWINGCGLLEMTYQGNNLSWCNGQEGLARSWACLDRGFVNTKFLELVPQTWMRYLGRNTSDHAPMVVSCNQILQRYGPSPFQFQQMWVEHKDYIPCVKKS